MTDMHDEQDEPTIWWLLEPFLVTLSLLGLVFLLLFSTGCTPKVPDLPPPPPSPLLRTAQVTIRKPDGKPLLTAGVRLTDDYGHEQICPVSEEGRAICVLDSPTFIGVQVYLDVAADGYKPRRFVFIGSNTDQYFEDVILQHDVPPMNRLVIQGQFFHLDTGERFTVIEATDFNLLARFLAGEDIHPILQQRQDLGFNVARVFTAFNVCPDGNGCQAIGRLVPREHPDYYDRVPAFLDALAQHGLYAELVAFTGPYPGVLDSDAEKIQHWQRLCEAARTRPNVLLERVNEADHPANRDLPFNQLPKCEGVLSSAGSGTADHEPPAPFWDYASYHPGTGDEWMRKAIHNGWEDVAEKAHIPVLVNETTRFPDNDGSAEHAYDVGRGCALMVAGCTFHSISGKNSRLWAGLEYVLADAWTRGAKSLPLVCRDGAYRRIDDEKYLRVYERVGVGADCRVNVRH